MSLYSLSRPLQDSGNSSTGKFPQTPSIAIGSLISPEIVDFRLNQLYHVFLENCRHEEIPTASAQFLIIPGPDSLQHPPSNHLFNYLFGFSLSPWDFPENSLRSGNFPIKSPEALQSSPWWEEVFLSITESEISFYFPSELLEMMEFLLKISCQRWKIAFFTRNSSHEGEIKEFSQEFDEYYKIFTFIRQSKRFSHCFIPRCLGWEKIQEIPVSPPSVDSWPLIQSYGLEDFGSHGFFTVSHQIHPLIIDSIISQQWDFHSLKGFSQMIYGNFMAIVRKALLEGEKNSTKGKTGASATADWDAAAKRFFEPIKEYYDYSLLNRLDSRGIREVSSSSAPNGPFLWNFSDPGAGRGFSLERTYFPMEFQDLKGNLDEFFSNSHKSFQWTAASGKKPALSMKSLLGDDEEEKNEENTGKSSSSSSSSSILSLNTLKYSYWIYSDLVSLISQWIKNSPHHWTGDWKENDFHSFLEKTNQQLIDSIRKQFQPLKDYVKNMMESTGVGASTADSSSSSSSSSSQEFSLIHEFLQNMENSLSLSLYTISPLGYCIPLFQYEKGDFHHSRVEFPSQEGEFSLQSFPKGLGVFSLSIRLSNIPLPGVPMIGATTAVQFGETFMIQLVEVENSPGKFSREFSRVVNLTECVPAFRCFPATLPTDESRSGSSDSSSSTARPSQVDCLDVFSSRLESLNSLQSSLRYSFSVPDEESPLNFPRLGEFLFQWPSGQILLTNIPLMPRLDGGVAIFSRGLIFFPSQNSLASQNSPRTGFSPVSPSFPPLFVSFDHHCLESALFSEYRSASDASPFIPAFYLETLHDPSSAHFGWEILSRFPLKPKPKSKFSAHPVLKIALLMPSFTAGNSKSSASSGGRSFSSSSPASQSLYERFYGVSSSSSPSRFPSSENSIFAHWKKSFQQLNIHFQDSLDELPGGGGNGGENHSIYGEFSIEYQRCQEEMEFLYQLDKENSSTTRNNGASITLKGNSGKEEQENRFKPLMNLEASDCPDSVHVPLPLYDFLYDCRVVGRYGKFRQGSAIPGIRKSLATLMAAVDDEETPELEESNEMTRDCDFDPASGCFTLPICLLFGAPSSGHAEFLEPIRKSSDWRLIVDWPSWLEFLTELRLLNPGDQPNYSRVLFCHIGFSSSFQLFSRLSSDLSAFHSLKPAVHLEIRSVIGLMNIFTCFYSDSHLFVEEIWNSIQPPIVDILLLLEPQQKQQERPEVIGEDSAGTKVLSSFDLRIASNTARARLASFFHPDKPILFRKSFSPLTFSDLKAIFTHERRNSPEKILRRACFSALQRSLSAPREISPLYEIFDISSLVENPRFLADFPLFSPAGTPNSPSFADFLSQILRGVEFSSISRSSAAVEAEEKRKIAEKRKSAKIPPKERILNVKDRSSSSESPDAPVKLEFPVIYQDQSIYSAFLQIPKATGSSAVRLLHAYQNGLVLLDSPAEPSAILPWLALEKSDRSRFLSGSSIFLCLFGVSLNRSFIENSIRSYFQTIFSRVSHK